MLRTSLNVELNMKWSCRAVVLGVLVLAGCGGEGERSRDTPAAAPPAGPRGTGMGHMDSMMRMSPDRMRAHMDSMKRMSPEQRRAIMAEHGRMMTRMTMSADPAWRALADSLRADVAALPGLQGEELAARLREHARRMERLLAMSGP